MKRYSSRIRVCRYKNLVYLKNTMRKFIAFIIFLIIIFITNLVFYILSDDYKFFLKKLKWNEEEIYLEEKKYDDVLEKKYDDEVKVIKYNEESVEKIIKENDIEKNEYNENYDNKEWILYDLNEEVEVNEPKNEVILWKSYNEILDLFTIYELKKLEFSSSLFDLTDEYPDHYYEYYSKDLTLYFFTTRTYNDLYDIFWILEQDLPFYLSEINNFWDKSFYVNLDKNIEDRFIRLVISNKWIVFWLKIKKNDYWLVKSRLNTLRENNNIDKELSWTGKELSWTGLDNIGSEEK